MNESSPGFRQRKWTLALRILGAGMALALVWMLWAQFVRHETYPRDTILGNPTARFSDFTDETLFSTLPNPYADPTSVYSPAAVVMFRAFSSSDNLSLILVFFFSLTALALLLVRLLDPIFPRPWPRVAVAFFFLAISYPLLFCLDRGNIEIILAPLIGWALYYYSRHRDLAGTACLFPAICLKFYPAILLVLLLRKKKAGLALATLVATVIVIIPCIASFPAPLADLWSAYRQNLVFFRDYYVLDNSAIGGSASLWNAYKIVLLALEQAGLLPHVVFGFDGAFIRTSYRLYSLAFALFSAICIGHAWLVERHQARSILMLLLLISISVPSGSDYRLIYASMALVLLALLPQRRAGDWLALVLIALAVIPKKEIVLDFIGPTESRHADVTLQALLNPLLLLAAIAVLLHHARPFDRRQAAHRLRNLLPSRWRWA